MPETPTYTVTLNEGERAIVLKALREARERTPATGVTSADWLEKDQIDAAKLAVEEAAEAT